MNLKQISKAILLLLVTALLLKCSDQETSLNIKSITVTVASTTVLLGETVELKAVNQDDIDITDQVMFNVGGEDLDGNNYNTTVLGQVSIRATYQNVKSTFLMLMTIENITEVVITADKTTIKPINSDVTHFTVLNQENEDVTDAVEIYRDGVLYEANSFFTDEINSYEFYATFNGLQSNSITILSDLSVSSINITSDKTTIPANGFVSANLHAVDQDADTITNFVSFSDGDALTENLFTTDVVGTHDIKATYEGVESNLLTIEAEKPKRRKVLIEEFTGEWCGWCPQAAYNLDLLVKSNENVLTVGIHNGDALEYENEAILRGAFGLNYFPSGLLGRVNMGDNVGYNGPQLDDRIISEVNKQLNKEEVHAGLSINTSMSGSNVLIDVDVQFYNTIEEDVAVTIYLIENNVISGTQENYFSGYLDYSTAYYYSQPARITDYVHQYVLRTAATDIYGDAIPQAETVSNNTFSLGQKSLDLSAYDMDNCYIIAFAHYSLDGSNQRIINAQQVKVGAQIGFDE